MNKITNNLSRETTETRWTEEIGFLEDSGYELSTIYTRALGSLQRAFKQGQKPKPELGFSPEHLPPFNPLNRLRVTIELLGPEEPVASTEKESEQPAKTGANNPRHAKGVYKRGGGYTLSRYLLYSCSEG